MQNNKSRNLWIGAIGIVVLALIVVYLSTNKSVAPIAVDNTNPVVDTNVVPVNSNEDTSTGSVNTGSGAVTISYTNALAKYTNARIQLNTICQASPNNMTFKNGTNIMIDNRAPVDRVVKVGSIFNIKAYSFKIIKLSSATLPVTWLVDCDKSQNVATILIQK